MKKPTFASPELQNAFDEVEPQLTQFTRFLDERSKDITLTEETLRAKGICIPVTVAMKEEFPEPYPVTRRLRESLRWEIHKDTWRLLYCRELDSGELNCFDPDGEQETWCTATTVVQECRPLIETAVPRRLEGYKHLPDLFRAIAKSTGIETSPGNILRVLQEAVETTTSDCSEDDLPF